MAKYKKTLQWLVVGALMTMGATVNLLPFNSVQAAGCPDVRIVFARGSGGERWNTDDYLTFRATIESKLATTSLSYEFIDLDYPAVGIGDISILAGAYFGAGEAYEFGASVKAGVQNLIDLVNNGSCTNTKYVLGGYSQGAMTVSGSLGSLNADKIIYAATFGDPKLYLPEGAGIIPAACKGENLSDYRMYVPDCQAYKGMLGAYIPYEPLVYAGKVGTWCNKRDIFCSSKHWDLGAGISDHVAYVSSDLYEDASRVIFDKICKGLGIKNSISSPHDTAILIDSTGSMSGLIAKYKEEALRLAEKTLASGGRVALYDYRDYQEGYRAVQRCAFESCTLDKFAEGVAAIEIDGGGDEPESLLASSLQVMQELNWKQGSTKSIVVLTDAGYHEPDFDIGRTTRLDVVRLSKQIDPVNFYIITKPEVAGSYAELALETGGRVVTTVDDLTELTEYIMERYDSLPRVEEMAVAETELPGLEVRSVMISDDKAKVEFTTTGARVLVVLNDALLGMVEVEGDTGIVTIGELDLAVSNTLLLVPLNEDVRGEGVEVMLNGNRGDTEVVSGSELATPLVPKAPNTGRNTF
ncbi:cutinase family protein [Candidatus Saccharibacteria bacterium]|nr:cutinase family protein [Candidatus Saccharibacteria bacterium]